MTFAFFRKCGELCVYQCEDLSVLLVLVTLCEGNHFRFIEERYKKIANSQIKAKVFIGYFIDNQHVIFYTYQILEGSYPLYEILEDAI